MADTKLDPIDTETRAITDKPVTTDLEMHRQIVALAHWDETGATKPVAPYTWETVARIALDCSRAVVARAEGHCNNPDCSHRVPRDGVGWCEQCLTEPMSCCPHPLALHRAGLCQVALCACESKRSQ